MESDNLFEEYKKLVKTVLEQAKQVVKQPLDTEMLENKQDRLKALMESKRMALEMVHSLGRELQDFEGGGNAFKEKKDFKQTPAEKYAKKK